MSPNTMAPIKYVHGLEIVILRSEILIPLTIWTVNQKIIAFMTSVKSPIVIIRSGSERSFMNGFTKVLRTPMINPPTA